jgi:hypothetical protein
MRFALALIALLLTCVCSADVYKTIDKDGNVVYTDSPKSDNAEKIELRELNTVPPAPTNYSPDYSNSARPALMSYKIDIISPSNNLIIPVGQRDLAIAISLDQPLQAGHLLVYYMDGDMVEETMMTNILIKDVMRGPHQITVEVMDESGQSLGMSEPVTVNLMRPIVPKPASPKPKPKPIPKPTPH